MKYKNKDIFYNYKQYKFKKINNGIIIRFNY